MRRSSICLLTRIALLDLALLLCAGHALAQGATSTATPALTPAPVKTTLTQPAWADLTPAQRNILAPLQNEWPALESANKKKWLKIAQNYPKMKPQEQQRAQQRMQEWVQLTPEQHRVARDSYARAQKLTPEKRAELLKAYQALPEEKKRELARSSQVNKKLLLHQPSQQTVPTHAQIGEGLAQKDAGPVSVSK